MVQQTGTVFLEEKRVEWSDVRLPLMSDAVLRSASVFDGMICRHVLPSNSTGIVAAEDHIRRLQKGVLSTRLEWRWEIGDVMKWCHNVAISELGDDRTSDVYVRPMVSGADIHGSGVPSVLTIAAFRRTPNQASQIRIKTSSWRRPPPDSMSSTTKSVANYHISRMSRLQAAADGFEEALLLNSDGRVAEAAGAAIVIDRNGGLSTPPPSEGCLPSVTVDIVERLAVASEIAFQRCPLTLADVYSADGVALVGTLADVIDVVDVDGVPIERSPVLALIRNTYLEASRDLRHRCHSALHIWLP